MSDEKFNCHVKLIDESWYWVRLLSPNAEPFEWEVAQYSEPRAGFRVNWDEEVKPTMNFIIGPRISPPTTEHCPECGEEY